MFSSTNAVIWYPLFVYRTTYQIFMKILPKMYLCTRKILLNLGSIHMSIVKTWKQLRCTVYCIIATPPCCHHVCLCSLVSESANRGHLRSAAWGDFAVQRSRTTRYGQRCFAVSGPALWNSLPLSVRDPSLTLTQFCARLKTVILQSIRNTSTVHTWQFIL